MDALIRSATTSDVAALVELRASMFAAMRTGDTDGWRDDAASWFARRIADGGPIVAVAEVPGAGVVACAMALVEERAPSPTNPTGLVAHVSQVSTLAAHRRRGYAAACLASVLAEVDRRGIVRTDLHATADGLSVYRALGFLPAPYPSMRRSRRS